MYKLERRTDKGLAWRSCSAYETTPPNKDVDVKKKVIVPTEHHPGLSFRVVLTAHQGRPLNGYPPSPGIPTVVAHRTDRRLLGGRPVAAPSVSQTDGRVGGGGLLAAAAATDAAVAAALPDGGRDAGRRGSRRRCPWGGRVADAFNDSRC